MRIDIKLLFNGFINRIMHNNIKLEEEKFIYLNFKVYIYIYKNAER
jgi:hypothetical protein